MGWTIAHIASDEALRRAVCAEVRSEGDPFARSADVSSMTSAGITIAANRAELPLLDKCGRETNRLYGILLLVRAVRTPDSLTEWGYRQIRTAGDFQNLGRCPRS